MIKRLFLGAVLLLLLVAACTGVAHVKALQPRSPTKTTMPTATTTSPPAKSSSAEAAPPTPGVQLGVGLDFYYYPAENVAKQANAAIAYVKSLHANSLCISFPFFVSGPKSNSVYPTAATPTIPQLAVVLREARQAGLFVSVRPLLDEHNLGMSRVHWKPRDPVAWFASYTRFLLPYATLAQYEHVSEFIVGTEFSAFAQSSHWKALDAAVRTKFHGTLAFANNWTLHHFRPGGGDVQQTVDAYHPMRGDLTASWEAYDRTLPPAIVETEVGIAAVQGASAEPYRTNWNTAQIDPSVQAQWFTAACRAASATHLGGIYFWPIDLGQKLTGPTVKHQGRWAGGQGAQAIAQCFASFNGLAR